MLAVSLPSYPYKPEFWLILLEEIHRVIDESEARRLAATKVGSEAEADNHIRCGLVHFCQLLPQLRLGDAGTIRVQDIHHLKGHSIVTREGGGATT